MSSISTDPLRLRHDRNRHGLTAMLGPGALGLCLVMALGCGSEEPGEAKEPDWQDKTPLAYKPCDKAEKVGAFSVELAQAYTAVSGSVAEEVLAADVPELVKTLGDCRLERQRNLFCDPSCGGGETCAEDGKCVPYPENIDVGQVDIWGLAARVSMEADDTGRRYWDTDLPHPGFRPGADIHLSAAGGKLSTFTLRGFGVSALKVPVVTLELESGKPLEVRWTKAAASPAHVQFTLNIDQHGVTPLSVVCDAKDEGLLTVPGELVAALFDAGPTGFPSAKLLRRSVDSQELAPGCVEFSVHASAELSVKVSGHMPCARDEDCLAGGRCNLDIGTCQ